MKTERRIVLQGYATATGGWRYMAQTSESPGTGVGATPCEAVNDLLDRVLLSTFRVMR